MAEDLVYPGIRTKKVIKHVTSHNDVIKHVTRHNDVIKPVTRHNDVIAPMTRQSDVTRLARSGTRGSRPPPRPFNPSAFHFHFSGADKNSGLQVEEKPDPDQNRDFGILNKLEDMFDYLRSIGIGFKTVFICWLWFSYGLGEGSKTLHRLNLDTQGINTIFVTTSAGSALIRI